MSEQEVDTQSGVGLSLEGAESSSYHTPPTSLPLLITGPGEDSDVSLDMPLKKRVSQDSGVSRGGLDRTISEVSSMIDTGTDDSGKHLHFHFHHTDTCTCTWKYMCIAH